jgi:hypothetical protein
MPGDHFFAAVTSQSLALIFESNSFGCTPSKEVHETLLKHQFGGESGMLTSADICFSALPECAQYTRRGCWESAASRACLPKGRG